MNALCDIHIEEDSPVKPITSGEFVMLRGPSGGGKTSLLNVIGGLDSPSAGYATLFGERLYVFVFRKQ